MDGPVGGLDGSGPGLDPDAVQSLPDVVLLLEPRLKEGSRVAGLGALKEAVPGDRRVILTSYAGDAALLAALSVARRGWGRREGDGR